MTPLSCIVILLAFSTTVFLWFCKSSKINKGLPPGPRGLPLLGHLHYLIFLPHQSLFSLSKKYGPLMTIRLGIVTAVVVSSKELAKEVLTTYDGVFSSRPKLISPEILCYKSKDIACGEYTEYLKNMRKICMMELFSAKRMAESKNVRHEEMSGLLRTLYYRQGVPVILKPMLSRVSLNVITRTTVGRLFFDDSPQNAHSFLSAMLEVNDLLGAVNIGDYIPWLWWFDPMGFIPRLKKAHWKLDGILQKLIDEHRVSTDQTSHDFIDALLKDKINDDCIKAVLLDLLVGATDTTSISVEWALTELLANPACLQDAQHEIDLAVGRDRIVTESDLQGLKYLKAIVKESFRLHPPAPMMAPHKSVQDCVVRGYKIPKNTWLMVNLWSIGHDPSAWEDAESFKPERFMDVKERGFELIPFGSGRRMCVGMALGQCIVELMLAQLIHAFDWELPKGVKMVNMKESQGVVMRKKEQLVTVAKWRLSCDVKSFTI